MWHSLTHTEIPLLQLMLRAGVVYLSVLILLRISGKRQMGQMGATEFVSILLISNAVQNAMNGGDNSLAAGLVLAGTLIFTSAVISFLTYRSRLFEGLFEGNPTLIIHKGKLVRAHLAREHVSESELRALLRKQGVHSFEEVETGILEADGSLSLTRSGEPAPASSPHTDRSRPSGTRSVR